MLRLLFALCLLGLQLALADIEVNVDVEFDLVSQKPVTNVNVVGTNTHLITEGERRAFRLTDEKLKACIARYKKRRPSNIFLHNPTPWNNLYTRFNWPEIESDITFKKATVTDVRKQTLLSSHKRYVNPHATDAKGKFSFTHALTKTISTSWEKSGAVTAGGQVGISVGIKTAEIGASAHFETTRGWGQSSTETKDDSISDTAEMEFIVKPHTEVHAIGYITKTKLTVKIEYEARIHGKVVTNFDPPIEGHHFKAFEVTDLISLCPFPSSAMATQYITLDVISGSEIRLHEGPMTPKGLSNLNRMGLVTDKFTEKGIRRRPTKNKDVPTIFL